MFIFFPVGMSSTTDVISRSGVFQFLSNSEFNVDTEQVERTVNQPSIWQRFFSFPSKGASESAQAEQTGPPPKVLFANERTFLHWMNFVLYSGALSVALLQFGDSVSRASGVIFTIVTIILMFYALSQYHARLDKLEKKERDTGYEDYFGARMAMGLVGGAIGISLVSKMVQSAF